MRQPLKHIGAPCAQAILAILLLSLMSWGQTVTDMTLETDQTVTSNKTFSSGSLKPQNLGQVASSQAWLAGGLIAPVLAQTGSGGSLLNGHQVNVEYSLVTAAGETLPSNTTLIAIASNNSLVTVTAPTIPAGYTGYTVYTNDASVDALYHKQTATNACVNITINCVITAVTASGQPLTVSTAVIQPPGAQATTGAVGELPYWFFQTADGNYQTWLGVDDSSCDATNGPTPCTGAFGTPKFVYRTYFSDTKVPVLTAFKNSFVAINHQFGTQTLATNQDRALGIFGTTPAADSATRFGIEGIQSEVDIVGTPVINGSPDGEAAAGSFQLADFHTNTAAPPTKGFHAVRAEYFRESGAGTFSSCAAIPCMAAITANFTNLSTVAGGSSAAAAIVASAADSAGGGVALQGFGLYVVAPGTRFSVSNYGVYIKDFGTNAGDQNIDSVSATPEGGKNYLEGKTYLNHVITGGPGRSVAAPTCSSTGANQSACSVDTGSNDLSGTITVTSGSSGTAALGTVTLTYNATYGANSTSCVMMLSNAGTGAWNTRATVIGGTMNTGSAVVNWDNNAVVLSTSVTYKLNYWCPSK